MVLSCETLPDSQKRLIGMFVIHILKDFFFPSFEKLNKNKKH